MLPLMSRRELLAGVCALPLFGQSASAQPIELNAGPLSLVFEPEIAFVRYVRLGDREVLRGIYAAVRDSVWGTVPAQVRKVEVKRTNGGFVLTFTSEHKRDNIDFAWTGTLTGSKEGVLKFAFDGKARSTFERNRIGFCVLHPMRECAGQPCTIEKTDGTIVPGRFPDLISPHQPFFDIRAVRHTVSPGLQAEVRMEGDTFEMEDHRNWTDANFKTYCTPLANPYPVRVEAGSVVQQSVTLTLKGSAPRISTARRDSPVEIEILNERRPMPKIGFGYTRIQADERRAVRNLAPAHIRVDLHLSKPFWKEDLAAAQALGVPLELAIFGSPEPVVAAAPKNVARYLVFDGKAPAQKLDAQVLVGTNDYFTELNRQRPPRDAGDGTCYSLNPQVHAFDNASLVENLEAQASTVQTARSFAGDRWIAVTPVTLRPRFVPANGTAVDPDPRQSSPFAAAWTLGSIKYLAESGANSITYYELSGKGGVLGFPVENVFGIIKGAEDIVPSRSSDTLRVEAAVFTRGNQRQIVLANMTNRKQSARVSGKSVDLAAYEVRSL